MNTASLRIDLDLEELCRLAADFRGTRCEDERQRIVARYADAVNRLIESGIWTETPDIQDQLPDERMPQAFFDYWECERLDP